MPQSLALIMDLLLSSFVLGASVWFFFIQSPALIKWMGRDKFVPIQMRLTKILFKTLSIAMVIITALALVHTGLTLTNGLVAIFIALGGTLFNTYYVIPRALKAGGKGRSEEKNQSNDKSVGTFAVEGSGPSAKFWHLMVVGFVVVMLGGLIPHMITLLP